MFVVLKENEGGLTNGLNGGVNGFGSTFNQGINQVGIQGQNGLGNFGLGYQATPGLSDFGGVSYLNNGYAQGNVGTIYGNTFGLNSGSGLGSGLGGNGALSTGTNFGGNIVGTVAHGLTGFSATTTQRREIQALNTLTGQIVDAIQEITPVASYTPLNTFGVAGTGAYGQQTAWGTGVAGQKALIFNLIDNDQSYAIECFSPDFDTKNSEVTLTPNGLRVRITNGKGFNGDAGFYTIPTPCDVDYDKITAQSSKGYLKISLPRSKKALESFKKIKID